MQTYKLLPGGGIVAFQTEQSIPCLWLSKLHSLSCSFPLPRTLHSTVGERLYISRIPKSNTNTISHVFDNNTTTTNTTATTTISNNNTNNNWCCVLISC